ncbi:TetR/AcrR family transcriptional regulator [Nocardia sp. NPDC019395]|uniref:TetR/AcrR family transcriptional regulator n=1 Tax=Nocardia sp. NPDC019395 TaxID=3154686 RepID=UPI0033E7EC90
MAATRRLMLAQGYAAITYRGVATEAGVTPGLVQYHFPLLDQLFEAVLATGTDRLVERLGRAAESEQPLRAVWAYASDPAGTALLLEFMALARHRKSIAPALGAGGERLRKALLAALEPTLRRYRFGGHDVPASAIVFLMSAIPRMIHLEESLGTFTGHVEVVDLIEKYLDQVEPKAQEQR